MQKLPANILELTSLRTFAAIWVVVFHFYDHSAGLMKLPTAIFRKGYLGVDLFFMLSGFILSHVYFDQLKEQRFSYKQFIFNRLVRLYPLHLFVLLAFVCLYVIGDKFNLLSGAVGKRWDHLPYHFLMLHSWGTTEGHSWNFPSWSISAEFFAYLLFPILVRAVFAVTPLTGLAISLVSFVAAFFGIPFLLGRPLTGLMYDFGIFRILFEFVIGVALYRFVKSTNAPCPAGALISVTAGIVLLTHFGVSDLWIVPLFALLIFGLARRAQMPDPWFMRGRVLVFLGQVSYSTYMIHYLVQILFLGIAKKIWHLGSELPFWAWTLMLGLVYLLSALTYLLIEEPARRGLRRFLSNPVGNSSVGSAKVVSNSGGIIH